MKNLKILFNLNHLLPDLVNSQKCVVGTSDYNSNFFNRKGYVYAYKNGDIFTLNPVDGDCNLLLSLKNVHSGNYELVDMFYNSVLNSLIIALVSGDVYSATPDLCLSNGELQCVGSIATGLQVATLSPDTETIVFLTGDNTLILMSGNFDPFQETELFGSDQGEQEMINVGWGKKETQFHGSVGKAAAKIKLSEEEIGISTVNDRDQKPNICWRGDSSLFAVSYWCPMKNYQKIKIFDKGGKLQCTSEFLPGLEGVLSWRPSGNLIALAQKLPNKHVVCFMEKNGLRHGDFMLPPNIKVLELSWNSESTILSAVSVDESVNQPCVLLWTTGNYHWYLKQRLNFTSGVVALRWDDVIANLAHILLEDGNYLAYQWTWTVDHSAGLLESDLATVAVIDGYDLKLSAFKKCIIPPPMCGATVTLPCPPLQLMFSPVCEKSCSSETSPNDLYVYLCDGRLGVVKGMETSPQLHSVIPIQWKCAQLSLPSLACLSHWLWLSQDKLLCIACNGYLCEIQLESKEAFIVSTLPLEEPVLTISQQAGFPYALVQLRTGDILVYKDGELSPSMTLPEPCVALHTSGQHTFGRTHNSRLYVDDELIANNVTSFFYLPQFLVMTLSSHQLCVTSAESGYKIQNDSDGTTSRRLERGSTLVVVVGHSVVLQLPRGNLETVQPRALTLVTAARLLDAGDYKAVAQLLRRQRIDLNLCVDHNPSAFLLSVPRLVSQVRDPQWLSVFLAELNERDVTRTMYAGYYKNYAARGPSMVNKVERVCTALREAMAQTTEDRELYLQPILSTYVRTGRVGEAITLADSDQALNYLILLMDADKLYEEALAVYNLEKALKIAGRSLKDPKEYVAYLNDLKGMDPAYMKFTIDKRLRKPESALRNLVQCSDRTVECLQYIKDTSLYSLALTLFKDCPETYKQVCLLYGAHLQARQKYEEAGLMYQRGGDVFKAVSTFTRAGCWQKCLTLASQHNFGEQALSELHQALYTTLHGNQQYTEATELCCQLSWWDQAVTCCVEARHWSRAIYLCYTHNRSHLIESAVKPPLLEYQARSLTDLQVKRAEMDKHSVRLQVVRQRKADMDNNFDAMSDIQSDTSSLSSFSTSSAGTRTTKNTRKAQRKLWSLKEGNPREEQALLYTITELIQNTERLTGDVHSTCLALAEFGLDTEASTLHSAMVTGLEHIQRIKQSIWPDHCIKKTGSDADAIDPTSVDTQLSFPPASCVLPSWSLNIYT